jgi:hypothetical protein
METLVQYANGLSTTRKTHLATVMSVIHVRDDVLHVHRALAHDMFVDHTNTIKELHARLLAVYQTLELYLEYPAVSMDVPRELSAILHYMRLRSWWCTVFVKKHLHQRGLDILDGVGQWRRDLRWESLSVLGSRMHCDEFVARNNQSYRAALERIATLGEKLTIGHLLRVLSVGHPTREKKRRRDRLVTFAARVTGKSSRAIVTTPSMDTLIDDLTVDMTEQTMTAALFPS